MKPPLRPASSAVAWQRASAPSSPPSAPECVVLVAKMIFGVSWGAVAFGETLGAVPSASATVDSNPVTNRIDRIPNPHPPLEAQSAN